MEEKKIQMVKEEQSIEFEKLFRENKKDLQKFIELSTKSILKDKEYLILFDEEWYSDMQSGNRTREYIVILYEGNAFFCGENKEIEEVLNENTDLRESLNFIREKEVITRISIFYIESMQIVKFWVDTAYTPFITTNNGVPNAFAWCDNKECEKYGYKNIEGNWYMRISPAPE